MSKLEKLQSEIGGHILKLSNYHADLTPVIGLRLPSMKARILLRKLSFLAKLLSCNEDNLSASVFRTISTENVYNISLVQQCKWLQGELKCEQILDL